MFTALGYLYKQIHTVSIGEGPQDRLSRMYYAKPVKLQKGVDNQVRFWIRNQDQKKVNIAEREFYFNLIDTEKKLILLTKRLIIENAIKGELLLELSREELYNFDLPRYTYSLSMKDTEGRELPVYNNDNYDTSGSVELQDWAYPVQNLSQDLTIVDNANQNRITETVDLEPSTSTNHTAVYYLDGFSGKITVQGHLENSTNIGNEDYFVIAESDYSGSSGIEYINFSGNFLGIRFLIETDAGTVDKILYKN
jgi:hypothetical protein